MAIKKALRLRKTGVSTSAALFTLYSNRVESGRAECFQQLAWEIDKVTSGGNTRVRLYIEGHGYKHFIEEQDIPAASTLYTYSKPLYLYESERLALEIDQAQTATAVKLFGTGYWQSIWEGG
ncbi:hypothetical protein LCGC14_0848660 [marine sediment metagenome]|uniref:Uncharacterized protein n=1 Tax=marine sediment metagenome TaxID=412755 RepID=A0A0F9PAZ1_9ZZZZ